MLLKGYFEDFKTYFQSKLIKNKRITIMLIRSLQAQALYFLKQKKKKAHSLIPFSKGSITVEASLALPIFLCVICSILTIGQFLLIDAEVQQATSQTAREIAMQKAVYDVKSDSKSENSGTAADFSDTGSTILSKLLGTLDAYTVFHQTYDSDALSNSCMIGGTNGIVVTSAFDQASSGEGTVTIKAEYVLNVPYLHYFHIFLKKESVVSQRVFSGFEPHSGSETDDDPIVYVTLYGGVYHTSLTCSNICRKISGGSVKDLKSSGMKPCSRCIKAGMNPTAVYVTGHGTHYHSSLTCSEIKRSVRAVRKSELAGMRMCSKCAKSQ